MKLLYAPASPFARKVHILIIELGLQERIELVKTTGVSPVANHNELNAHNPLGMIPALVLDNGDSLYDSPVICEYLNQLQGADFFPTDMTERFRALQLQALADGMMDVSVALRYEIALRPETLHWEEWITHQYEKIERSLDALEQQCTRFSAQPTIGELAVACELGYLDFRFTENDWRANRLKLAAWFEGIMQRDSLQQTPAA